MTTDWTAPLTCLVFGTNNTHVDGIAALVGECDNISQIDEISRLASLRDNLSRYPYDFVVVMLENADDNLPACLLRYPELRVLVVTPARKVGAIETLLTQGASDVVSVQRRGKCRHALDRIITECRIRVELRIASRKLESQNRLQKILLDSREEAVLLWQNGEMLESNCHLDALIECHSQDNQGRGIEWRRWVSAPCYAELHSIVKPLLGSTIITNHRGAQYKAKIERLHLESGEAQLIRITPHAIDNASWNDKTLDTVTGVLLPDAFVNAMDCWLHSTDRTRYTVAQIRLNEPGLLSSESRANSTVQELLSYRIAALLEQEFKCGSLIGRTGATTMTLLPFESYKHSRDLATRIRRCLGTVGDLIDDTTRINIKTLTLSPHALSAREVVERLNQPPLLTRRILKTPELGVTNDSVPVLSVRA